MNRRSFFAAVDGVVASAKAKITPNPDLPKIAIARMKIGNTITIRKPPRFIARDGMPFISEPAYVSPQVFADESLRALEENLYRAQQIRGEVLTDIIQNRLVEGMGYLRIEEAEPSADIPLAGADDDDEWPDDWD